MMVVSEEIIKLTVYRVMLKLPKHALRPFPSLAPDNYLNLSFRDKDEPLCRPYEKTQANHRPKFSAPFETQLPNTLKMHFNLDTLKDEFSSFSEGVNNRVVGTRSSSEQLSCSLLT